MKRDYSPNPKPGKRKRKAIRVIDTSARDRKLSKDGMCRCDCGRLASDGHHIVRKGSPHFGDDVEDNIMPLYHECHMSWHDGRLNYLRLTESEKQYALSKIGPEAGLYYLENHYGLELPA